MRMWMIPPEILCDKHLYGEHVELHMFVGTMRKMHSLGGYVANNLVEPGSIVTRHRELVEEIERRDGHHKSPIDPEQVAQFLQTYPPAVRRAKVNKEAALRELIRRCPACRQRNAEVTKKRLERENGNVRENQQR